MRCEVIVFIDSIACAMTACLLLEDGRLGSRIGCMRDGMVISLGHLYNVYV